MDRIYTAWELAGDWWWVDKYMASVVGGHTFYDTATAGRRVCLRRAEGLHRISRYVSHDTKMRLKEIITEEESHE